MLKERGMSRYRLAVEAGIPHSTLSDICNRKTLLEKASADTVYKLSKVLNVPMERLISESILETRKIESLEHGLPGDGT